MQKNEQGFPISQACKGERCLMCHGVGKFFGTEVPATHKVQEEILYDDPRSKSSSHNLTAYVCCYHYRTIFGAQRCCHDPN